MSKLKLAGPALLFVGFLLPAFAQDAPASMFAKQVEHDIAALSSQPSVGAWQELHPDEKLELMLNSTSDSARITTRGETTFTTSSTRQRRWTTRER